MVCRVFKKKNHNRGGFESEACQDHQEYMNSSSSSSHGGIRASGYTPLVPAKQINVQAAFYDFNFDGSMHLPQLLSPESVVPPPSFISPLSLNNNNNTTSTMDIECSQNLLRLTTSSTTTHGCGLINNNNIQQERMNINGGDWSFLDKLLASHQSLSLHDHHSQTKCPHHHHPSSQFLDHVPTSAQKFPFQYLGCETDILKFSK